jgi:uncharacterized protein YndB with AHSA1/START domain
MPVRTLEVTLPSDREIRLTRVFDAPRRLVFDALTRPELLKRWHFGPDGWSLAVCEIDLRVGGAIRFVWRKAEGGREMSMSGSYREIRAPERLVTAEVFDDDWTGGQTVTTTQLTEEAGRTTFVATVLYQSPEARGKAQSFHWEEGAAAGYDRLAQVLAEEQGRRGAP